MPEEHFLPDPLLHRVLLESAVSAVRLSYRVRRLSVVLDADLLLPGDAGGGEGVCRLPAAAPEMPRKD
jgi:hypothetical protein